MVSRRNFLKVSSTMAAAAALPRPVLRWRPLNQTPPPPMDPGGISHYVTDLVVPPAMPKSSGGPPGSDFYRIAVRQFPQQILPGGLPATPVWGYGSIDDPASFNYPAFTIEAQHRKRVTVQWINGLVDSQNRYLPHLLPVDPTLHWANPPGPRDKRPSFSSTPGSYQGPVPIVTHVHGGTTFQDSDGYPEAWYLPNASNIPAGYFHSGTFYQQFAEESLERYGSAWPAGSAIFNYPNDQAAATLWYHDHTLGITRLNVYAGLAGFYLLRGGPGDIAASALPAGQFELPLAIQDRSFYADGSLRYPVSRSEFDEFTGPYIPTTGISPIWNPEFFGDTMVVNGRTWPNHRVQPRRYRLRLLNGCDSRFLILKLVAAGNAASPRPVSAALPLWQIGSDAGFLDTAVAQDQIVLGPGERADVVVDFTGLAGQSFVLINEGPDEPFGGGVIGVDFEAANPLTTGQVMRFQVNLALTGSDGTTPPAALSLPALPVYAPRIVRQVSLNEVEEEINSEDHVKEALLGTVVWDGNMPMGMPMMWDDEPTETPTAGVAEEWQIFNFTMDAHPIHLHETQFRVVGRRALMDDDDEIDEGPPPGELGLKDTVIAYPDAVTYLHVMFKTPGRFVWHCHILSHEDNEMMRPMQVQPYRINAPVMLKRGKVGG